MRRSIAVGHGLTILWVFATAQVMCRKDSDEDAMVYKAVNDNKEGMVAQMIVNDGFERASKKLDMTPLSRSDMNPTTDDDDDDASDSAEKQQQRYCRRTRPRSLASMAPKVGNTGAGTYDERQMLQAKDNLPVNDDAKCRSTNYDGQKLGYHPRGLNSVPEGPSSRRDEFQTKEFEDSRPVVMVQL